MAYEGENKDELDYDQCIKELDANKKQLRKDMVDFGVWGGWDVLHIDWAFRDRRKNDSVVFYRMWL